jgi:hypothetical protein
LVCWYDDDNEPADWAGIVDGKFDVEVEVEVGINGDGEEVEVDVDMM